MPPVGLLAIVALVLVFALALPERIRETGQYSVVRTEDRYRADMRVIRESAARVEAQPVIPTSTKRTRALAPRNARASIKALGGSVMSRPAAPLDRAANLAQRQEVALRKDLAHVQARRAARAQRRRIVGSLALFSTSVTGGLVLASAWPVWSFVAAITALGGVSIAGRRAVIAQRAADAKRRPVEREVTAAAAATSALRRVVTERAQGHDVLPSIEETQAIAVVTRQAVPEPTPTMLDVDVQAPVRTSKARAKEAEWSPGMLPIPTYTLKAPAKVQTPRPITEDDLAEGKRNAELAAARREAAVAARAEAPAEPEASTQTLDDILARRRRQSA
jgi:hypothetical protein